MNLNKSFSLRKVTRILGIIFVVLLLVFIGFTFTKMPFILTFEDLSLSEIGTAEEKVKQLISKSIYSRGDVACPAMPTYDCSPWFSVRADNYLEARKLKKKLDQEFPEYKISISWSKTIVDFIEYGGNSHYIEPDFSRISQIK